MLKFAITGNIASGKSTVRTVLEENSPFKVFCLDEVVQNLYKNNEQLHKFLFKNFNTCDKKVISNIVFSDKSKLNLLNEFIHPLIKDELINYFEINKVKPLVIVDVPLLFEVNFNLFFDKIIFVSALEDIRLKRLKLRNGLDDIEAKKRINSQMKEEYKINLSDYVIKNNGDINELKENVLSLIEWIKLLV